MKHLSKTKHPKRENEVSIKNKALENEAPKTQNLSVLYKHETVPCQVTNTNQLTEIKHDNKK